MDSDNEIIQRKRLALGLLWVVRTRDGQVRLRPDWGRWVVFLLMAFLLGWWLLFSAAYLHLKFRRGYQQADYLETLTLPFHHDAYQLRRGEYYLEQAYEAMRKGNLNDALHFFRNGLMRAPHALDARLVLADFYEFLFGRPTLSMSLLKDGLPYFSQADADTRALYLDRIIAISQRHRLDREMLDAGELLLLPPDEGGLHDPEQLKVAYQVAVACRNLALHERSESVRNEYRLDRFAEGLALKAQSLWDRGRELEAIALVQEGLDQFTHNQILFEQLIHFLSEKGEADRAWHYSLLYQVKYPDLVQSALVLLTQMYEGGRVSPEVLHERVKALSGRFLSEPQALRQLAVLSSRYGDTMSTRFLLSSAVTEPNGRDALIAELMIAESLVRSGEAVSCLNLCQVVEERLASLVGDPDALSIVHSLRAAAHYQMGNLAQCRASLQALLDTAVLRIDRYLAVARLFLNLRAPEIAREVLESCKDAGYYHQDVREGLIEVFLMQGDGEQLFEVLGEALDARRLPNDLLARSHACLSSDRFRHLGSEIMLQRIEACFDDDYLFR
jgi:hypothetical protein